MKKIISIIAAAAMTVCSTAVMDTNAFSRETEAELISRQKPGYDLLYTRDADIENGTWKNVHDVYMNTNDGEYRSFLNVEHHNAYISICVPAELDDTKQNYIATETHEAVLELLQSYCPGFTMNTRYQFIGINYYVNLNNYPEVREKAREIVREVQKIADVNTACLCSECTTIMPGSILDGDPTNFMGITREQAEEIDAYMQATGLDYTAATEEIADIGEKCICLDIDLADEITEDEEFELALDIVDRLEIDLPISWAAIYCELIPRTEIDLLNSVEGDANSDSEVGISDVTYIMQSMADPDAYVFDAQQSFNADVTGSNDGVTAEDALVIQKYLAGQTDTLG